MTCKRSTWASGPITNEDLSTLLTLDGADRFGSLPRPRSHLIVTRSCSEVSGQARRRRKDPRRYPCHG